MSYYHQFAGKIIAVEGIDASGKNTQTKRLADFLREKRNAAIVEHGPLVPMPECSEVVHHDFPHYPTETGQSILGMLRGEWECTASFVPGHKYSEAWLKNINARVRQSLFLADRCEWMSKFKGRLLNGLLLVLDRYYVSGVVYGSADGLDTDWLWDIHGCLPQPDLYVYIDIPVDESYKRRPDRRDEYERRRDAQEYVRKAYLDIFIKKNADRYPWHIVNGVGTPDEVHERITKLLDGMIL
jgi:thymidylate kinase